MMICVNWGNYWVLESYSSSKLPVATKLNALLLLYLKTKRPVDEVEIQVIQLQGSKSLLAGSLHQRLVMKCAPQLETKSRHTVTL